MKRSKEKIKNKKQRSLIRTFYIFTSKYMNDALHKFLRNRYVGMYVIHGVFKYV